VGREVVRICATHGETSRADVEELVGALEAARDADGQTSWVDSD
jgi:hypothetical protein